MEADKNCQSCSQEHDCDSIYGTLGNSKNEPIATKIVVVFLLPILVFIASLICFEKVFSGFFEGQRAKTATSALLSVIVSFAYIMVASFVLKKNRISQKSVARSQND